MNPTDQPALDLDEVLHIASRYVQGDTSAEALPGHAYTLAVAASALVAEVRRLGAELERRTEELASADNPTRLRWGLNDVMYGDDDTTIVMLSGPDGAPYWLELDPERAAVLREDLAGPGGDDEGLSGPCDCGEGAVHYTTAECPAAQRAASA